MKRKQLMLFAGMLMLGMAFFATSCSDDSPEITSDWVSISVRATDWEWVEENDLGEGYYMARKSVPELTNYIYNNGVITAYTVFDDGTMTALPFLKSYGYDVQYPDGTIGREYYTEYIGFDFYVGEIIFVLEVSDLQRADDYLIDRTFEVRMAW